MQFDIRGGFGVITAQVRLVKVNSSPSARLFTTWATALTLFFFPFCLALTALGHGRAQCMQTVDGRRLGGEGGIGRVCVRLRVRTVTISVCAFRLRCDASGHSQKDKRRDSSSTSSPPPTPPSTHTHTGQNVYLPALH